MVFPLTFIKLISILANFRDTNSAKMAVQGYKFGVQGYKFGKLFTNIQGYKFGKPLSTSRIHCKSLL
jgi:hypothetical protein